MNVRIQIRAIGLLCCLLLTHWAFSQTTRYVSTTGLTPAATATSWAMSTTDLQGAINASQPGDQVWVAAGVYKPTTTTGPDSRAISFSMKNGVAIYGGFLGSETIFSQRPPVNPVAGHPSGSTLSGDIGIAGNAGDNSYHVISNPAGLTTTAVLDGFVITGGGSADYGGAMYNDNSSPTLTNCSLQGNFAGLGGGAMYNNLYSSPTLTNCSLQGNSSIGSGGAMYNDNSSPTLTNCSLQGNSTRVYGGAMYNNNSSPTLTNCSLQGNSAEFSGGAMYNNLYSSPTLTNCSLQGNSAEFSGGAMYNSNNSSPTLTSCSLQGNSLTNLSSFPTLTNCVLWSNGGGSSISGSTASYCLFDASVTGYGGSNNLTTTTSPFVSATSVALATCSPAINAGNPASATAASGPYSATALPATDLTGNVRITGTRIDMGAVEYQQQNGLPLQIVQQPVAGSIVCAGTTVVMSVSVTGSSPAYQWYRSGTALAGIASATTASLTLTSVQPADAGSYSVVISGDCPSVTSTVFSLSVNALPSVTVTAAPSATLSCTNQSLTLMAQTSATSFTWSSGGSTGQTLPVSQTGVYSVTVTDGNGCTAVSNSPTISRDNTSPTVSISAISNQLSCTQPELTLTATSSATALLWSSGETTMTISVSQTGTYSVTATGANGCTAVSNNLIIGEDNTSLGVSISALSTTLSCTQPELTLTATSSTTGLLWSTGETTTTISVSQTGTYSVTATGANGCTAVSNNLMIGEDKTSPTVSISAISNQLSCTQPELTLTATSSATALLWSRGETTTMISVSQTGTYSVTATGANGCTAVSNNLMIGEDKTSPTVSISAISNQLSCTQPELTLTATASTTGLLWSTGETTTMISVSQTGTYSVTATGANGCTAVSNNLMIGEDKTSPVVSISALSTTLSCTQPELTLTATSSATALLWSSGETTMTISVSQTGTYSVTATGANGCTAVSNNLMIGEDKTSPTVSISAISNQLSCTQPELTLTATSSATALLWSSGETTMTISVSQTGTYSVTATGANGCTAVSNNLMIGEDKTSPVVSISALSSTLTCTQPQLTLTATASTTGLRWSTGETTTTISVSTAGTYSVIATGANGCTVVSNNLPVTENFSLPPFTVSSATVCPGQSVNLTASGCGGQILWSTGATTAMITLTAGSSTSLLTATCTAGICSTTANGQIVIGGIQPPPAQILSFTADESACPVRLTGRGVATSFTMTGPKGYVFSTVYREGATHDAVGLNVKQAGTYTLTATYTNSCGTSAPVTRTVTVSKSCP